MPQLIASVEGVEIKHLYLQKNRTTLGRKAHNDVVFDNMVVSGEHCVFELSGIADVHIEDLHSTNGTYINNQMIKSRQQLRNNDIISIGNFRIRFLAASEQDQPEAHGATTAMSLSSLDALGFPGTSGTLQASLKLLSGPSEGLEVALVKAVTTFGQTGVAVVSVQPDDPLVKCRTEVWRTRQGGTVSRTSRPKRALEETSLKRRAITPASFVGSPVSKPTRATVPRPTDFASRTGRRSTTPITAQPGRA